MTPLQAELEHLMNLMAPPYRANWKAYCWAKANALVGSDPENYKGLPAALTEAMTKKPLSETPSEQRGTE